MLFKLLGLPFTLPAAGMKFVFNTLVETAENELMDDGPVKEQLLELQLALEEGEVSEEEFQEREQELFRRLREIRAYREERLREQLASAREEEEEGTGVTIVETGLDQYGER